MVAASQKLLSLVGGRQPGDPGDFEPPLPVWRKPGVRRAVPTDNDAAGLVRTRQFPKPGDDIWWKPGAGIRKPMLNAIFLVAQPAGLTLLNRRRPLNLPVFIPDF